jgi:hypothetical protein
MPILSERINARNNEIGAMEAELAKVMQDIMVQRKDREQRLNVPAEDLRNSPVKFNAEQYTLRLLEESSSQVVDLSPQKNGDLPTDC